MKTRDLLVSNSLLALSVGDLRMTVLRKLIHQLMFTYPHSSSTLEVLTMWLQGPQLHSELSFVAEDIVRIKN